MLLTACFTLLVSIAADECGLYLSRNSIEESSSSFCNDFGYCEGIHLDETRRVVAGDTSDITASHLILCDEAFEEIAQLTLSEVGVDTQIRPMPSVHVVSLYKLAQVKHEDNEWRRNLALLHNSYRTHHVSHADIIGAEIWMSRSYPAVLESLMNDLESRIEQVQRAVQATFPRVTQESLSTTWASDILDLVHAVEIHPAMEYRGGVIRSIFRNSEAMRGFEWTMRMMMEFAIKVRTKRIINAYLQSVSPFAFVFSQLQSRLRIDFIDLYRGMESFIVDMSKIAPPVLGRAWEWRLPGDMISSWSLPELPLILSEEVDWTMILQDAGVEPPPPVLARQQRRGARYYKNQLEAVIDQISTTAQPPVGLVNQLAALLHFADRTDMKMKRVCRKKSLFFDNMLLTADDVFHVSQAGLAVAAVLNRCSGVGDLSARIRSINTISQSIKVLKLTELSLPSNPSDQLAAFLEALGDMSKHALAGTIRILFTSNRETDLDEAVPGGIQVWFGKIIDEVFSSRSGFLAATESACTAYSPVHDNLDTLRAIGRLLALYLRDGYADNKLGKYLLRADCGRSAGSSVKAVLFLGSESIRSGFYDVFQYNDFELALSKGGIETLFDHAASEAGFFRRPSGKVELL